ncbi:hypothetical protein N7456_000110 [Penicillium angulare]|uniref:Glycolipid transfer protein domain-containing protein n=1 Tax=Penicillium angulare TaxID=116970 RepID=A0A9W9GBX4_9EURO|nr:hypothetical protein N7456_000110 [Penicillium angulare]
MATTDSNWLKGIKGKSFADISVDAASFNTLEQDAQIGQVPINTEEFLRAADSLVTLFNILGPKTFKLVIDDLNGNITKVRTRMLAAPAESQTLQDLVLNELKTGKHTATEGLLWLCRGIEFTVESLHHNLQNPSVELKDSFNAGYAATLSKHHGWLAKKAFGVALGWCPKRAVFYKQLADADYKEGQLAGEAEQALGLKVQTEVIPDLNNEVDALRRVVKILKAFQASKEAQW